jgi:hypothetical protein
MDAGEDAGEDAREECITKNDQQALSLEASWEKEVMAILEVRQHLG